MTKQASWVVVGSFEGGRYAPKKYKVACLLLNRTEQNKAEQSNLVEKMIMEEVVGNEKKKKMRLLCLHGFRTSGSFLKKQISKWDPSFLSNFDMDFPNGLFPAGGKSDIEAIFPPPYFEWFQFDKDFTEYTNLEECTSYLCEYITTKGPFDGLLGFSQGATLSALLIGYQTQGVLLKDHPPMKLFVSISGSKFRQPSICDVAYKDVIKVKSVHFIGAKDWLKLPSEDLATAFHNPLIVRHPQGHTVPRLDEVAVEQLRGWISDTSDDEVVGTKKTLDDDKQHDELENGEIGEEKSSGGDDKGSAGNHENGDNGQEKSIGGDDKELA